MRRIVIFITVLVAFSLCASAEFADMPNNWSTVALQAAVDNGLLEGDGEHIYPDRPLTRAELATIIVRAFGVTEKADISRFTDVTADKWYFGAMAQAVEMGALEGDGNQLRPEDRITREEAFVVIARVFSLKPKSAEALNVFKDSDDVSTWSAEYLSALVENGYVEGANGKLDPKSKITRAEFAQLMYNAVSSYIMSDTDKSIKGNAIIKNAVTLKNVTVDGDLIVADGVKDGVKLENVRVKGRLILRSGNGTWIDGYYASVILAGDGIRATVSATTTVEVHAVIGDGSYISFKKNNINPAPIVPVIPDEPDEPNEPDEPEAPTNPEIEDDEGKWSGWYD